MHACMHAYVRACMRTGHTFIRVCAEFVHVITFPVTETITLCPVLQNKSCTRPGKLACGWGSSRHPNDRAVSPTAIKIKMLHIITWLLRLELCAKPLPSCRSVCHEKHYEKIPASPHYSASFTTAGTCHVRSWQAHCNLFLALATDNIIKV